MSGPTKPVAVWHCGEPCNWPHVWQRRWSPMALTCSSLAFWVLTDWCPWCLKFIVVLVWGTFHSDELLLFLSSSTCNWVPSYIVSHEFTGELLLLNLPELQGCCGCLEVAHAYNWNYPKAAASHDLAPASDSVRESTHKWIHVVNFFLRWWYGSPRFYYTCLFINHS